MGVKWIIADIDGCLSPEESVAWEWAPFAELARVSREASAGRGPVAPLALCTGRPQPYAEALMKVLDIRAPAICESGAVLYALGDNRGRYGPGVTPQGIAGLRALRAFIESEILPGHPQVVYQFGKEAHLSLFCETPAVFGPIVERIREHLRGRGGPQVVISASHYYLNIALAGVDKGRTVGHLLDELGVGAHEAAGIGDTEGDLPVREHVGFFACPANATPRVKAAADYVSPLPTVRGVLDILSRPQFQRAP